MIDASKGFVKDGNKNRLRHQDIHKIVDVFNKQIELPKYSRMVSMAEIEANDYNLNIPRYIDSTEAEDLHDIEAHLLGGIPNRDIDGLDVVGRRLIRNVHPESSNAGDIVGRAPNRRGAIKADAKFVQQARVEDVSFLDHDILRDYVRSVRVG